MEFFSPRFVISEVRRHLLSANLRNRYAATILGCYPLVKFCDVFPLSQIDLANVLSAPARGQISRVRNWRAA